MNKNKENTLQDFYNMILNSWTYNKLTKNDIKEYCDGFFFNEKAIRYVEKLKKDFFINSFYNLTVSNILIEISELKNLLEFKKQLFKEYKKEFAAAWFENMIYILES